MTISNKIQTPWKINPRIDRLTHYVVDGSGCWIWKGGDNSKGYGFIRLYSDNTGIMAHRYFYLHFVGEIPKGLVLDHLCRNRRCVNPGHLEPVSDMENFLRGESSGAKALRQSKCKCGRAFDALWKNGHGSVSRKCKHCTRVCARAYRLKRGIKPRPRLIAVKDLPKMRAMRERGISAHKIAKHYGIAISTVYANT